MMLTRIAAMCCLCIALLGACAGVVTTERKAVPINPAPSVPIRQMVFPSTSKHLTLTADLHTHSVFSDGNVWPNIRVAEGLRDGLDILAVTEHLEWQPHRSDLPNPDRNRAYQIAQEAAKDKEIIVLPGAEITREMPVGHINAIFVRDANTLFNADSSQYTEEELVEHLEELPDWSGESDVMEHYARTGMWPAEAAIRAANAQQAFLFWNHPSWTGQSPDGKPLVSAEHKSWFTGGLVQGIEVVNGNSYSPESFQLALDNDLAVIGTSDVHDLIDWDYLPHRGGHRPVTLIFATAQTPDAVREALFARRTAIWFRDTLLGREDVLAPLVSASLESHAKYLTGTTVLQVRLENRSSVVLRLKNDSELGDQTHIGPITVPAQGSVTFKLAVGSHATEFSWPVTVENAFTAPGVELTLTLKLRAENAPETP
jgi:hypothetical protein